MSELEIQPINDGDWDYLIVLDACRYDKFEEIYDDYFKGGELRKVESRGSATPEWLEKSFPKSRYNMNYISANPHVNTLNLKIGDFRGGCNSDWNAKNKFVEIKEPWITEWNPEHNTVTPQDLKNYVIGHKDEIEERKTIIHFIQPHRPFINNPDSKISQWGTRKKLQNEEEESKGSESLIEFVFKKTCVIWKPIFDRLSKRHKSIFRDTFGLGGRYRRFYNKRGSENVEEFYEKDLELALREIAELIEELEGKIVITSDHGESWGENYEYGHPIGSNNPVLLEVPWMEIEK